MVMSSSDNSGSEANTQNQSSLSNSGNAEVESFTASSDEIESIIEHIEAIDQGENIEVLGDKEGHWVVKYNPSMEGAKQSSARNNDFNILHEDGDVVREFLEGFEKAEEMERENLNAIISQGRNISDIVAHMVDEPIKRSEGNWSEIVLAAEEAQESLIKL
jgi:hypothetical protein